MEPRELAQTIARILDGKMGEDIRVLEVTDLTILADFFVLCTGNSTTHLKTLTDECEFKLKQMSVLPHHLEGRASGSWILLDYGSVLVHVFTAETRSFYNLERLWADAKPVELHLSPDGGDK